MVNKHHIKGAMGFDVLLRLSNCPQMDVDHMPESSMLMNLSGNIDELFFNFETEDFGSFLPFNLIGKDQGWIAAVPTDL